MWRTPVSSDGDARVACRGCNASTTYIVACLLQRMNATPVCECLPWTLPSVWTNVHGNHRIQVLHPLLESYDVASLLQNSFPSNSEIVLYVADAGILSWRCKSRLQRMQCVRHIHRSYRVFFRGCKSRDRIQYLISKQQRGRMRVDTGIL